MPKRAASAETSAAFPLSSEAELPTLDLLDSRAEASHLLLAGSAIGFVGSKEVGHQAFDLERKLWPKTGCDCGQIVEGDALAAHAGVNFKMDGEGFLGCGAGGFCKLFDLPWIPDDWREAVLDNRRGLAGESAAHEKNA